MLRAFSLRTTALERALGLRFKDPGLLKQALTHPSYLNEHAPGEADSESYQRLEFLGDSMLGVAVTSELFVSCPELSEGQLTKLRSSLVRGSTLARVARSIELGASLRLGRGEESTGGRDRDSNLAATFEALVGAVLLDRGFDAAHKFVGRTMRRELDTTLAKGVPEDPKSRLQELVQGTKGLLPLYRMVEGDGSGHGFNAEVLIGADVMGKGHGRRKVDAEKEAARAALSRLEQGAA